ncbi:MAG: hypothetical protein AAFN07_12800 [Pseudomonadota bacterium]
MSGSFNGTSYRDQLDRVERFFVRVQQHNKSHTEYDDDLWSFFIHAWALKDWIKNDEDLPEGARNRIVTEVEDDFDLQVCADIANRTKHVVLNRHSRHDSKPVRRDVVVGGGIRSTHHIGLKSGDTVIAQELAERVVAKWKALLNELDEHAL